MWFHFICKEHPKQYSQDTTKVTRGAVLQAILICPRLNLGVGLGVEVDY